MHKRIAAAEDLITNKQAEEALGILEEIAGDKACTSAELARVRKLCGSAHEQLVQFNQAFESFDAARAMFSELDDERTAADCNARCAINLVRMKQLREGVYRCNAVLPIANENGWKEISAVSHHALALADYYSGEKERAAEGMVKASDLYRELGLCAEQESVSSNLAMIYLELGREDLAQPHMAPVTSASDDVDEVRTKAKHYLNTAVAAWYKGDVETAKGLLAKAQQIGQERSNFRIMANAQTNLGLIYLEDRDYRIAHKMLILGWQNAVKCSDSHVVGVALMALATTMIFLNDGAQALQFLTLCLDNNSDPDSNEAVLLAYYAAIVNLANDNVDQARLAWKTKPRLPTNTQLESELDAMSKLFEHIGTVEFREQNLLSNEAMDLAAQWCSELGELELGEPADG